MELSWNHLKRDEGQKPQQLPLNGMCCASDDVALPNICMCEGTTGDRSSDRPCQTGCSPLFTPK